MATITTAPANPPALGAVGAGRSVKQARVLRGLEGANRRFTIGPVDGARNGGRRAALLRQRRLGARHRCPREHDASGDRCRPALLAAARASGWPGQMRAPSPGRNAFADPVQRSRRPPRGVPSGRTSQGAWMPAATAGTRSLATSRSSGRDGDAQGAAPHRPGGGETGRRRARNRPIPAGGCGTGWPDACLRLRRHRVRDRAGSRGGESGCRSSRAARPDGHARLRRHGGRGPAPPARCGRARPAVRREPRPPRRCESYLLRPRHRCDRHPRQTHADITKTGAWTERLLDVASRKPMAGTIRWAWPRAGMAPGTGGPWAPDDRAVARHPRGPDRASGRSAAGAPPYCREKRISPSPGWRSLGRRRAGARSDQDPPSRKAASQPSPAAVSPPARGLYSAPTCPA